MRLFFLLSLLLLSACGRPLSAPEKSFLQTLHGDDLNPARIRVVELGLIGLRTQNIPVRPRTTCRELIHPEPTTETVKSRTAGMVGFNWIWVRPGWFIEDYVPAHPDKINLSAAMFLAHEATHVWQWQNRALTNYHPLKGALEHRPGVDPYLFETDSNPNFLEFGYEQQASLVEEFVCCRALDPTGARTERLAQLLSQVMPVTRPGPNEPETILPWPDADTRQICS